MREFITRHTAYNKHDTGWAKGAPSGGGSQLTLRETTRYDPRGGLNWMSAFLTTPGTADVTRQAARSLTPPHNRQTSAPPPRTPSSSASSLRSREACTGENLEGDHIFHPRTVLLCGVCTLHPLLFRSMRCRRRRPIHTSILESTHTNKHTHTNTNKRTAQPVKVRGAGSRRIYTVKPCSLESLVKGGLLTPRGRATGPSRAN